MHWLPSLFAAEAIPSAMITFVALLMFVQLGVGWEQSTLLCGLLTLPWVLKSFVRARLRQMEHYALQLKVYEAIIWCLLVGLAFCFTDRPATRWLVFACLFILCLFCASHELVARMYYERKLRPRWQRYYNSWKMFISQSTVVLTYGVMIVAVGFLEVFYHTRRTAIPLSWSMAVYTLAGLYLLLVVYNFFVLREPSFTDRREHRLRNPQSPHGFALIETVKAEVRIIDRIAHKRHWLAVIIALAVLLLPQALMFHARVLFFIGSRAQGGLGVSLQWIGLAQGTVGVIAFSAGLAIGHLLLSRQHRHPTRLLASMAFLLCLSPVAYLLLATSAEGSGMISFLSMQFSLFADLLPLCVAAFIAQFCFGYGLNCTMPFIRFISGERYRSTINYLYIPLISLVMLLPMAASGWLVTRLGFPTFFLLDSLLALPAWLAAYLGWHLISNSQ